MKSNRKNVKSGKIDTLNTQIHERSLSLLDTDTSVKRDGVKLVLLAQLSIYHKNKRN